jgi:hypothetical protein
MFEVFRHVAAVTLLAVAIGACSPAAETPAVVYEDPEAGPLRGVVDGLYVYGHEVRTFQPCGSHRIFWVQGAERILTALRESHAVVTTDSYEEVFVRLKGEELPKVDEGYARDYDGVWLVQEVLVIRKRKDGDCAGSTP